MLLYRLRIPIIAGVLSLLVLALCSVYLAQGKVAEGMLQVTFLDVGQGDATFIESPTGTQVLIDGGRDASVLRALTKVVGFFDRDIDMVVATHPDADHIGGLVDVLDRYTVKTILMTENINDTPVYDAFVERVKQEGSTVLYARRGQVYDLGRGASGSTTLTILFPDRDPTLLESNLSSIIARLVYGENEYLLTGDSPKEIEEYLVAIGSSTLRSDVLKIGHHGSQTSTSELFLNAVQPTYGVISAGRDNSYGHPHREVTDRLQTYNVIQRSTAIEGNIGTYSDGTKIWFRK